MTQSNPALLLCLTLFGMVATDRFDLPALSAARAPLPKSKPRTEVIVIVTGYGAPGRLFDTDGKCLGDLPFDSVSDCVLSPGGGKMAVVVRDADDSKRVGGSTYAVYMVRTGTDRKAVGEPLTVGLKHPTLAWAGEGTLYISEHDYPPQGAGWLRPAGVTAYDLVKRTTTSDQLLQSSCVFDVSPDRKRLLARRLVTEPVERQERVVLDAETCKPVDMGVKGVTWGRFFGADRLIGTRAKPNGAADETEHVVFDPRTKKVVPVGLPRVIAAEPMRLFNVFPAPDGKRLLYCWTEEVPAPADWPAGVPCNVARLTIAQPDGGFPHTIFRPEVKERQDHVRNHIFKVDWK